jgi:type IV fimbrial biogenesis protein FimT
MVAMKHTIANVERIDDRQNRPQRGFTLVESVIVMAILAIVITIAAPSFVNLILTQRVKNASFDVFSSINMARSQAIIKNGTVTIVPTGGAWTNGWTVTDSSGTVVRTENPTPNIAINGPTSITYTGNGRLSATVTPFSINASGVSGTNVRCISIDLSGRPVVTNATCS